MPANFIDLTNSPPFGRLTVLRRGPNAPGGQVRWVCQCICGSEKLIYASALRAGLTRSCGCLVNEAVSASRTKHGATKGKVILPEYSIWRGIIDRCTNPNARDFKNYGGRNIRICLSYRASFAEFLNGVGKRPRPDFTLDRQNNNGHYSCGKCRECRSHNWPANCRWVSRQDQANNTRKNYLVTYQGITRTLSQWAVRTGINRGTLLSRLEAGWATNQALTEPQNMRTFRLLTAWGETLTLAQWSRRTGTRRVTIAKRLQLGWEIEKALDTPTHT